MSDYLRHQARNPIYRILHPDPESVTNHLLKLWSKCKSPCDKCYQHVYFIDKHWTVGGVDSHLLSQEQLDKLREILPSLPFDCPEMYDALHATKMFFGVPTEVIHWHLHKLTGLADLEPFTGIYLHLQKLEHFVNTYEVRKFFRFQSHTARYGLLQFQKIPHNVDRKEFNAIICEYFALDKVIAMQLRKDSMPELLEPDRILLPPTTQNRVYKAGKFIEAGYYGWPEPNATELPEFYRGDFFNGMYHEDPDEQNLVDPNTNERIQRVFKYAADVTLDPLRRGLLDQHDLVAFQPKDYVPHRMILRGIQRYSDPKVQPQYCITMDFCLFMDGRYNLRVDRVDVVQQDEQGRPIPIHYQDLYAGQKQVNNWWLNQEHHLALLEEQKDLDFQAKMHDPWVMPNEPVQTAAQKYQKTETDESEKTETENDDKSETD